MKMKTILLIMFIMIGILPYTATAIPGLIVTAEPISGTAMDYQINITNMDDLAKEITFLNLTISQTDWTYNFNPDLIGQTIPAVNGAYITTTLQITAPASTLSNTYGHQITANATYEMWSGSGFGGVYGEDSQPCNFDVQITGTTPIPEFPTMALPVLSVIGLMLVFGRRKS